MNDLDSYLPPKVANTLARCTLLFLCRGRDFFIRSFSFPIVTLNEEMDDITCRTALVIFTHDM